jgi:hypothetical protein
LAGDSWATQTSPVLDSAFNWSDVVWMAGTVNKFVAIGNKETSPSVYQSKIASSADGVTWAVEKTIAGRFESIAYNNNSGGVDEFVIGGYPFLGSTHSAQKSTSLSGTYTNVTVNGVAGGAFMNSLAYFGGFYVYCGPVGVLGVMSTGAADFTSFTPAPGTPVLNKCVADASEGAVFVMGDLTGGLAYIYRVTVAGWEQEGVGAYALHGYVNTGTARIVTGNGGTVFRTTSAAPGDFTVPYPSSVALSSPFSYWVLTEDVATRGGGATSVGSGDLSKLATGWFYVKVKTTTTDYIRCFAQNSLGVLVCGGDNGTLYKSTDYGNSWTDIGTALSIAGDVVALEFDGSDRLGALTTTNKYLINSNFLTLSSTLANSSSHISAFFVTAHSEIVGSGTQFNSGGSGAHSKSLINSSAGYTFALTSAGTDPYSTTVKPEKYRVLERSSSYYLPVVLSSGASSLINLGTDPGNAASVTVTKYTGGDISSFSVNTIQYSELYNEVIWVGRGGKAYVSPGALNSAPSAITTGITFDIEDVAFIAGAWVMLTRRGCLYSTDSATVTNLTSSDASITTKPAGNALISIPTQFRLVANDLGFPGYVRVCQL